jgi:hypothetical protein
MEQTGAQFHSLHIDLRISISISISMEHGELGEGNRSAGF